MITNLQRELNTRVLSALIDGYAIRLAFRPGNIKFDETKALYLAHKKFHNGLSVGDIIDLNDERNYFWMGFGIEHLGAMHYICQQVNPALSANRYHFYIAGFFKLTGYITVGNIDKELKNESRVRIEEVFCALSTVDSLKVLKSDIGIQEPVYVFWADGLNKVITK